MPLYRLRFSLNSIGTEIYEPLDYAGSESATTQDEGFVNERYKTIVAEALTRQRK